ncbi:hypothetical protein TNCV_2272621 [Trichonephila clavipes]|nr:hypothetical protein TNCV_2272621 [Trichonephila clavipes]
MHLGGIELNGEMVMGIPSAHGARKKNVAGQAYCVFCNSLLKYSGEGFKAFTNHSKTVTHIKYSKCIRHSMTLSNYANSKNTDDLLEDDARPLDIVTRKARQEFYDKNQNEVVVHHFASLKMESCNSEAVFKAVVNTIEDNNIPWANLISVLMDSCNTMRGKKRVLKPDYVRSNKAPHLLDIDGDTCNTANNCAKKFASCFDRYLEDLFVTSILI